MPVRVTGTEQLRAVARDLKIAGSPGRGLRSKLRRNLVAAAKPIQTAAQRNVMAIPVYGSKQTGLRAAIAAATKVRILTAGRNPVVRVYVDPSKMPAGENRLPVLMEGDGSIWRHPVYGHSDRTWVTQPSHSYFRPAVQSHLAVAQIAAIKAVAETAAIIERGI